MGMKRTKATYTIYSAQYSYWKQKHAEREMQRIAALARGEPAIYGYWQGAKQCAKPIPAADQNINSIPLPGYQYRLEITYKQANESIAEDGRNAIINLVYYDTITGKFWQTPKQAKHINNGKFIRDIDGRLCLKWKWKYYLII